MLEVKRRETPAVQIFRYCQKITVYGFVATTPPIDPAKDIAATIVEQALDESRDAE